jgi:MHS family proline/betaine transporter-like MFS transporter
MTLNKSLNKAKLIFSSGVANTFEWYDYTLFAHFATVIGDKFFPSNDSSATLLYAFTVFAIGYLMRPIGGIFFGILGDRLGRKVALSTSIICMALPTTFMGLLPTYDAIGVTATILMIVVRMMQGLSMGGVLTSSVSFVIEHTNPQHRGVVGSISMTSICLGILLGSLTAYTIKALLSPQQFLDWGWRIPFLCGILVMFVGIYIRKHISETPLFEDIKHDGTILKSPLREVLKKYWFDILISILINSTGSVIFYLEAVYVSTFLKLNRNFSESDVDNLINISYVIMAFTTVFVAWVSDRIGRRKIYIINLLVIAPSIFFIMNVFEFGNMYMVVAAHILLTILAGAYIGPEPALQAEFYPTNVRNTALSLSYNIAVSVFGGTAPLIIEYLFQKTGSIISAAYYVFICSLLSMIALYFYKDRSKDGSV